MSLMKEEPWIEGSGDTTPEIKSPNLYYGAGSNNTSSSEIDSYTTNKLNSIYNKSRNYYEFLVGRSEISPELEKSHVHPMPKIFKYIMGIVVLLLPTIAYLTAGVVEQGALIFPLSAFIIPSYIIGAPLIYFFYKYKGKTPYVKKTGIAILMAVCFIYYTLFQPLILLYFIQPFYSEKSSSLENNNNENRLKDEELYDYSSGHWLITLPLFYLHITVLIQMCLLSQCKMRTRFYLMFISYPASLYFTATVMSIPLLFILAFLPHIVSSVLMILPIIIGAIGLRNSLIARPPNQWEVKDICLRTSEEEDDQLITKRVVTRIECKSPEDHEIVDYKQPLSIVQITDPHLGPLMSAERLAEICENAVKLNPDLIFLTGDFFTTESFYPIDSFERSIAPLKKLQGKVFAILGNHDYEEGCRELLDKGLKSINAPLLVDQAVLVDTKIGKVQILGFDYRSSARQEHINQVCNAYPPIANIPRIGLLHDPGAFKFVPLDQNMLVLSGHTHGGLIGLHSLGIKVSLVSLAGMPDHGLFKNGSNYLYVHAGQGLRNLMGSMILRVGTISEDSLYQVYFENNPLIK